MRYQVQPRQSRSRTPRPLKRSRNAAGGTGASDTVGAMVILASMDTQARIIPRPIEPGQADGGKKWIARDRQV
jgi:hypothetical protein